MTESHAPEVSVVVGASAGQFDPAPCLAALSSQSESHTVEILFVANAGHPAVAVARRFPAVTVIESERPRLVPELWGLGVSAARGQLVAITISGCVPAPDWVARVREAHVDDVAAIGGAIEQAEPAGVVDWALYFVRYAAYMKPFAAGSVSDVPGDNGSYRVTAIGPDLLDIAQHGFWETEINRRLRARGQALRRDPRVLVWHTHSYDLGGFSRQRFRHGLLFGRERRAAMGTGNALIRAALAPLSLATMIARSVRHVIQKGRCRRQMVLALPLTAWFFACWIAGETVGLAGPGR